MPKRMKGTKVQKTIFGLQTAQFTVKSNKHGFKVSDEKKMKRKAKTEIRIEFLFVLLYSFYCAFARIETNYLCYLTINTLNNSTIERY